MPSQTFRLPNGSAQIVFQIGTVCFSIVPSIELKVVKNLRYHKDSAGLAAVRKAVAVTAIMFIFFLMEPMAQYVKVAKANPIPWCFNPQMTVSIQSPLNGTVSSLPVLVSFTSQGDHQFSVSDDTTKDWVRSFFYVLDGQDMRTSGGRFAGTKTTEIDSPPYRYSFTGQVYLTNLTDGPHSITVYYGAVNNIGYIGTSNELIYHNPAWQATSHFYVDSKPTPSPTSSQSPNSTNNPITSSNPATASNSVPYTIYTLASLFALALSAITVTVVIYRMQKNKNNRQPRTST
jgi:hypothetical protein